MRVLIIDDEQLALSRLSNLLGRCADVELVAAVDDAARGIAAIARLRPDVVLLDIEMPQLDGFDVVEALATQAERSGSSPPLIAFVTAFPQFAVEAFETGAIDFVCKPVRLPRLEKLLDRARSALAARDASERLRDLRANLGQLRETTACVEEQHLWVRHRGDLIRIRTSDIQWIEAQASYVNLHLGDRSFLVRNTIGSLADQLAPLGYSRVHKSALVNDRKVVGVKTTSGQVSLVLEGGAEVRVGRKYREAVRGITGSLGLAGTEGAGPSAGRPSR